MPRCSGRSQFGQITSGVEGNTCLSRSASPQPGCASITSGAHPRCFKTIATRPLFHFGGPIRPLQGSGDAPVRSPTLCSSAKLQFLDRLVADCCQSPSTHALYHKELVPDREIDRGSFDAPVEVSSRCQWPLQLPYQLGVRGLPPMLAFCTGAFF